MSTSHIQPPELAERPGNPLLLLNGLGLALDKFLDIICEVHDVCEPALERFPPDCPEHFRGSGFAVTFPCGEKTGVFIIGDQGDVLPAWHFDPGIAGRSRLAFLSRELARILAPAGADVARLQADFDTFCDSDRCHAARVDRLETLFHEFEWLPDTESLALAIHRMDGRLGDAWMFLPLGNVQALRNHRADALAHVDARPDLKPLRELEHVEMLLEPELAPEPQPVPTPVPAPVPDLAPSPEPPDFAWLPGPETFRKPCPRGHEAENRERAQRRILSQFYYAHPANTQVWRTATEPTVREISARVASFQPPLLPEIQPEIPPEAQPEILPETQPEPDVTCDPSVITEWVATLDVPCTTADTLPRQLLPRDLLEEVRNERDTRELRPDPRTVGAVKSEFGVSLGRGRLTLRQILAWRVGSVIRLDQAWDAPADVFLDWDCVGSGFPLECEGRYGIRLEHWNPEK